MQKGLATPRNGANLHDFGFQPLPSLKLTWHLKMDGWNTFSFPFWEALFSGAILVSGRVVFDGVKMPLCP